MFLIQDKANQPIKETMSSRNIARAFLGLVLNKIRSTISASSHDNGFGNNFVWADSLESGLKIATAHKKPMMVIIHKSYCKACKNLKPKVASSSEILMLSKHFVMVNLLDDEEPKDDVYAPDGNYIPRLFFVTPDGQVDHDIYNEDTNSNHKFFYNQPEQIAKSMMKAIKKYT